MISMKKITPPKLYTFLLGFVAALPLFLFYNNILPGGKNSGSASTISTDDDKFPQGYRIVSPPIPDQLDFAGRESSIAEF